MTALVGRVDHPVIAVHDLELTSQKFKKLGFVVPPSGKHKEWGTENLCIMFPKDYLEIRGIGDPSKFLAGVDKFLAGGEGLYSVAFNAKSAEASYREGIATGIAIEPPKHLNRKLIVDGQTLDLHFKTVMLGHEFYPGLNHANLCEHLTADTLRQPGWLDHPNGVISFGRLVGVVSDFDQAERVYKHLLGAENVRREDHRILLNFGEGADIELIDADEAARRGDAQPQRGESYLASATLLVKDIAVTERVFTSNGIAFQRKGDALAVAAAEACGARLYFKQATIAS